MPKEPENSVSFSFDEPEEPQESPSNEPEEPSPFAGSLFAGLSSSFLKDLAGDAEEEAKAEEPEVQEPARPRSQLAEQADRSGLIVDGRRQAAVRAPSFSGESTDVDFRWSNITTKLKESNDNIAVILEHTKLKKDGTSAYIVFDDKDTRLLSNLKRSQAVRQISAGIKDEFGAEHLYLCTNTQYSNLEKKNQETELEKKLDDLNERSRNMGVPTDFHFGD